MKYFLSIVVFIYSWACYGQIAVVDTLLELPEVEVRDTQAEERNEGNVIVFTKEKLLSYQGHSVADILKSEGLGFIKSYGGGSIATSSIRGGSAGQMAVFWNGLAVHSPMLGQVDLSILSLGGVDEMVFTKGGQSTSLGSGAMSGSLQLSQAMPINGLQFQLASSIGSFAQQKQRFSIMGGGQKWRLRTSFYKNSAENNFPFQLRKDLPIQYTTHARTKQSGFEQALYWQFHPQHRLQFHYWQQQSIRLIPPTSVQTRSEARQEDAFHRSVIRYAGQSKKAVLEGQLAYFKERILFEDPQILLRAPTVFNSYIFQFSMARMLGQNWRNKGGVQAIHTMAEAEAYRTIKTQSHLAIYQQFIRELSPKATLGFGGRLTLIKESTKPIAAFHFKLNGHLSGKTNYHFRLSRDFRIPTLNDLYWIPGGNPDIETEYALGQELGIAYHPSSHWTYRLTVFNRNVDNWIQWAQTEASGFWSVDNITKVWSRGVEQVVNGDFTLGKARLLPQFRIDWIKSTYQVAIKNPTIEKGESLWYTPEWQAFAQLKIRFSKWSTSYSHRWTAATTGINKDLSAYHLGRFEIKYKHTTEQSSLDVFGRIDNVWNKTYRVIENRPMPGRNFEIGINLIME